MCLVHEVVAQAVRGILFPAFLFSYLSHSQLLPRCERQSPKLSWGEKKARKTTFPSLKKLTETYTTVNLASAVAIKACCCNPNAPWIKRLLKVHLGRHEVLAEKRPVFFQASRFSCFLKAPSTMKFFLCIHLKIISRKYNGKKPRVSKHFKRPAGYTSNKFLLSNYSISFKALLFTKGQNYWNYYTESELHPTSMILELDCTQ